jgi:uncharacterized membrane protein YuzA (DUF378 family)
MKVIRVLVMILIIIGALNWGLIGFFDYNLLADMFGGPESNGAHIVFSIIGVAGLVAAIRFVCKCSHCKPCSSCGPCGHEGPCGNCGGTCKCCGKENCQCKKR